MQLISLISGGYLAYNHGGDLLLLLRRPLVQSVLAVVRGEEGQRGYIQD